MGSLPYSSEQETLNHFGWTKNQLRGFRSRYLTKGIHYARVPGFRKCVYDIKRIEECRHQLVIQAFDRRSAGLRSESSSQSASATRGSDYSWTLDIPPDQRGLVEASRIREERRERVLNGIPPVEGPASNPTVADLAPSWVTPSQKQRSKKADHQQLHILPQQPLVSQAGRFAHS